MNNPHDRCQWYAVHCKAMREWHAAAALEQLLGLTVYVPEVRRRFLGEFRYTPLFSGYLFVRANLEEVSLSLINKIPGVLRLVSFGETPVPLPSTVIEALRDRVNSLNMQGGLPTHDFKPGDIARLKAGPLRGLEAVFVGPMKPSECAQVLINFLGSLRKTEVDVDYLERVDSGPPLKRERRTRGKGRVIKH